MESEEVLGREIGRGVKNMKEEWNLKKIWEEK
jgi:hypothetical protein